MRRIKIGLFIDTFFPMVDGVVMVVDNYARHLSRYADVTVFAPHTGRFDYGTLPYKLILCKSVPVPQNDYSLPFATADSEFRRKLNNTQLDIAHIHSPAFIGKAGMRYAKRRGIPAVITLHSQFKMNFKKALKSEKLAGIMLRDTVSLYDRADEIWAVNRKMAELYTDEYGGKLKPIVVGNATDLEPCPNPAGSREKINKLYGLRDDEKVLLYVGRIDLIKNILLILKALVILKQSGETAFKMLFVGSGKDEETLKNEISVNGLNNEVLLCGRIMQRNLLAEIYSRADLLLFPSIYDASSLVQIEAASQKTPGVFIRGSVTSDTVTDNVNGFCCEDSGKDLAAKIIDIFNDQALYNTVSEGSYRDLYVSWDKVAEAAYGRYVKLVESYAVMRKAQHARKNAES
ncbi:MAG: glycosyltransferase [Oscillospiraceae bacterium]|jgi:1,2-diacylglycerol 3-alpha-glucosyltransferase